MQESKPELEVRASRTEDGFCLWNIKNLVTELDKEHRIIGWKGDQCFLLNLYVSGLCLSLLLFFGED